MGSLRKPVGDDQGPESDIKLQADAVATSPTMFAKVEKSLISLGFFTPSSRRIKNQKVKRISFTRTIDGKKVEATAEFHPSAVFGLPITADQDKFLALHDIITKTLRTEGRVTNPIRFTSAHLLRLLNSQVRTGKNYKDISEWLDVMMATMIVSNGVVWEAGKHRFARDRFHVFQRAVSIGKEMPDGTIADANYVWLSDWQLENINQNFLLPIDLQTYRELKNHIAKALVPLLQVWLFASQKAGSFEKRYDELCEMLNLQVYKAPSLITRQLKPSFDELVRYEYLKEWRIEKTSDRKAYKIIFFHGLKFHRDRRRRLDQKQQSEPSVVIAKSESLEPELPMPGKLETVSSFVADASGETPTVLQHKPTVPQLKKVGIDEKQPAPAEERDLESQLVDELSTRGIMPSSAMKLLRSLSPERLDQVADYIDYWDGLKATKKVVGQGLLYNLIREGNPLPSSFETRRQREQRQTAETRRQKQMLVKDALTQRYEEHRSLVVDRFIAEQLPPGEFERRVAVQKTKDSQQQGLWNTMRPELVENMARHTVRNQIAEQLTFQPHEEFRKSELTEDLG